MLVHSQTGKIPREGKYKGMWRHDIVLLNRPLYPVCLIVRWRDVIQYRVNYMKVSLRVKCWLRFQVGNVNFSQSTHMFERRTFQLHINFPFESVGIYEEIRLYSVECKLSSLMEMKPSEVRSENKCLLFPNKTRSSDI